MRGSKDSWKCEVLHEHVRKFEHIKWQILVTESAGEEEGSSQNNDLI